MKLVVAVDAEWGIGYKGELLARVRADLAYFKRLTVGKTVICGAKTLETFPGGKPLPARKNVILKHDALFKAEGAEIVHSLEELFVYTSNHPEEEFVVIGGGSVYRQLLPYCSTAYVTKFLHSFEKDVYFENLDDRPDWALIKESEIMHSDPATDSVDLSYVFTEYRRII